MAESRAESDEGGGWWGSSVSSWYASAKTKSAEVLEFVRRDLDEFSTAVRGEAGNVGAALKDTLGLDTPDSTASTVKRSVSSFLGQVSQALSPDPDDDDEEPLVVTDSEPVQLTKFQLTLMALTKDPATFLTEPEQTQQLEAWRGVADEQLAVERLTRLLTSSPDLHRQYTTLVPEHVSHMVFWERYLFRKALLEDEEAQREAAKRRADREKQEAENFQWTQDEAFGNNVELSEEEQTRILLEYERECKTKKTSTEKAPADLTTSIRDDHYVEKIAEKEGSVESAKEGSNSSSLGGSNDEDWEREFDLSEIPAEQMPSPVKASGKK